MWAAGGSRGIAIQRNSIKFCKTLNILTRAAPEFGLMPTVALSEVLLQWIVNAGFWGLFRAGWHPPGVDATCLSPILGLNFGPCE